MAVTNTFSAIPTNTAWTQIVDGTTIASCGIQLDPNSTSVFLAIAQALPDEDSDDYLHFDRQRDVSISFQLNATDKVYARAPSPTAVKVRGYQVTR
jgi:hypothetical protein